MGMFDWVEYEANCHKCGDPLTGFQSKSGPCCMKKVKPSEVTGFYASCKKCGVWHNFHVVVESYHVEASVEDDTALAAPTDKPEGEPPSKSCSSEGR